MRQSRRSRPTVRPRSNRSQRSRRLRSLGRTECRIQRGARSPAADVEETIGKTPRRARGLGGWRSTSWWGGRTTSASRVAEGRNLEVSVRQRRRGNSLCDKEQLQQASSSDDAGEEGRTRRNRSHDGRLGPRSLVVVENVHCAEARRTCSEGKRARTQGIRVSPKRRRDARVC